MQELIEPMLTGKPYPIKGLVLYGTNLLHTVPDVPRTKRALAALDFVLAIDVLPQDHVAWADVVLPEATYLERHDDLWACGHKTPYIALREPAIEPLHDTKPGWWIAREMGKPYLADFEADNASPFSTPSKKVELYSSALAAAGLEPLPDFEPTPDAPSGYFRLLYGRSPVHTFARTQNTPVLHALQPENEIWVNEAVASTLGLAHGDRVRVENQDGVRSGPVRIKATPRIRPDCVFMVHGFGHQAPGMTRAHGKGASDAQLQTRYALDPISGGAGLRVNFVRLVRET
jgi:thiosulfate reductase/polysulfide reductase chain A